MKTTTVASKNPMNRTSCSLILLVIPFVLACFAFLPQARGTCQQGCLANENTVFGDDALLNNTGDDNTAVGFNALLSNTTGFGNTAVGDTALPSNTNGGLNTAVGLSALSQNIRGNNNVAIGSSALLNNKNGNNNIAVGYTAGMDNHGSDNIDIGNVGGTFDSGLIRIGTAGTHRITFIAGISGVAVSGSQVMVDSNGKLGVIASSARFKDAIKPMDKASEAILALKPVTFRYKKEIDPDRTPQFGLVAEEVEKVTPDLVARDEQGKPYTVRYEAVNAMLLNEFLKEHRKVEQMEKQIAALTAGLQKVSAQLELNKSVPQTVLNSH